MKLLQFFDGKQPIVAMMMYNHCRVKLEGIEPVTYLLSCSLKVKKENYLHYATFFFIRRNLQDISNCRSSLWFNLNSSIPSHIPSPH